MSDKLDLKTPDMVKMNIERIAALFPHCVAEVAADSSDGVTPSHPVTKKIDFDLLRQELSADIVEGPKERYRLEWPGKREAIVTANMPTTNTLRPVREDSVNFDTTENLYIEGDNLEVLKLLQESYLGKVKMIYIDPPYNTGNDFVYRDNFAQDSDAYKADSGMTDELGNRLVANPETAGRYHSDWLTMMYPRLKLARNLLTDDGVILINMDEHEITNLHKLACEIFGENNDLGTIIWDKRNPKGDAKGISYQHEYIVAFAKSIDDFLLINKVLRPKKNADKIIKKASQIYNKYGNFRLDEINKEFSSWINSQTDLSGGETAYNKIDENGEVYQSVSMAWPNKKQAPDEYFVPLIHPKTLKPCVIPERGWRNPTSTMKDLLNKNLILFGKDESTQPRRKYFLKENMFENIPSLLYYGGSDVDLIKKLDIPFDTPKVVDVVYEHIQSFTNNDSIILDFFSGSATTAHAVMQLNAEDGGNRKFIMVQLPEKTDEKSEAYKAGYHNICEIGKERIRRAGKKIAPQPPKGGAESASLSLFGTDESNSELKTQNSKLDIGFRVYRLDTSNMQDVYYRPQDYKQSMMTELFANHIKPDRTADDLVAQVMLDWGLPLSLPIEQAKIAGKTVYKVAGNALYCCFDEGIDEEFVRAMVSPTTDGVTPTHPVSNALPLRIVFHDYAFANDTAKENVRQLLKQLSAETEMRVV